MDVQIQNDQEVCNVDCQSLKNHAEKFMRTLERQDDELSILLVDDQTIQDLNLQHRKIDSATDVLSFPQMEGDEFISHMLGDVVISVETAKRQAVEHQFSLEQELVLLLLHGLLHLLGYDHERSPKEEILMKEKTWELFALIFPGQKPSDSCNY
ncbi:Metal-dependent hydrolase YbeY, involved in rRNA and/or ribosome maturation and assembly [hydrothermal vent metagenome]|uniref:Metal-dependent hydrolase YbeY, involved in rRNA and/or ribosome maturation and assembly n=1 Tax=hydrothermal vent metagenome TaxID=652676 RepID=A0A3B1CI01_9ZZZZ